MFAAAMGEVMRTSLGDVLLKCGTVEVDNIRFAGVLMDVFDKENVIIVVTAKLSENCVVEDDFRTAAGTIMADLSPTRQAVALSVLRSTNARAGKTEVVKIVKCESGRGGRIDWGSETNSSKQLLVFCVSETIFSPD